MIRVYAKWLNKLLHYESVLYYILSQGERKYEKESKTNF